MNVWNRAKALAYAYVRYAHAVGASALNSKLPFLHVTLHPFVPYAKLVVPVAAAVGMGHAFALDAMWMRILSDEEARRRHIAEGKHGAAAIEYYRAARRGSQPPEHELGAQGSGNRQAVKMSGT